MDDVLILQKKASSIDGIDCEFCNDVVCYNKKKIKHKIGDENNDIQKCLIGKSASEENILDCLNSECIICFEKNNSPIVTCSLCSNYSHYTCYNTFTKKNNFYKMKCLHCGTKSIQYRKKWWQFWCCYS